MARTCILCGKRKTVQNCLPKNHKMLWIAKFGHKGLTDANYDHYAICRIHIPSSFLSSKNRLLPSFSLDVLERLSLVDNERDNPPEELEGEQDEEYHELDIQEVDPTSITSHGTEESPIIPQFDAEDVNRDIMQILQSEIKELNNKMPNICEHAKDRLQNLKKSFSNVLEIINDNIESKENISKPEVRYSKDIMLTALYLRSKLSIRKYNDFKEFFVLPPLQKVDNSLKLKFHPGINFNLFEFLASIAPNYKRSEKKCVLLFDEMALSHGVYYCPSTDQIVGLQELGAESANRSILYADRAFCFMLRGVVKNFKQLLAYYLISNTPTSNAIKEWILEIVQMVQAAGFQIVATICDQASWNEEAINELISSYGSEEDESETAFVVNGFEIFHMYDPYHLLGDIKNNLMKYNLVIGENTAKWKDIQNLYNTAKDHFHSLLPNIIRDHKEDQDKKKTKYCTKIFSSTVAVLMELCVKEKKMDPDALQTAKIIAMLHTLFDAMNTTDTVLKENPYKSVIQAGSPHFAFFRKILSKLQDAKFVPQVGGIQRIERIATWSNLIITIKSLLRVCETIMKNKSLAKVATQRLNLAPLEHFFEIIRSQGDRTINPNCRNFNNYLQTILLNNIYTIQSTDSNCIPDDAIYLINLELQTAYTDGIVEKEFFELPSINDYRPIPEDDSLLWKVARIKNCEVYLESFLETVKDCEDCSNLVLENGEIPEFYKIYCKILGKHPVIMPSGQLMKTYDEIEWLMAEFLKKYLHCKNLHRLLKSCLLHEINFDWYTCSIHKQASINKMLDQVSIQKINHYCRMINRILYKKEYSKGITDEARDEMNLPFRRAVDKIWKPSDKVGLPENELILDECDEDECDEDECDEDEYDEDEYDVDEYDEDE